MDLEQYFDALHGRGYDRHGDGGEEAGCCDLPDCVLVAAGDGGEVSYKGFANIIALRFGYYWEREKAERYNIPRNLLRLVIVSLSCYVTGLHDLHIGVTPYNGADTPAYRPYSILSHITL